MEGSVQALFIILAVVVAVIWTYSIVNVSVRIRMMDRNLERTVLLLTVLANKQGATEEDVRNALGGSVEEAATSATESAASSS